MRSIAQALAELSLQVSSLSICIRMLDNLTLCACVSVGGGGGGFTIFQPHQEYDWVTIEGSVQQ